MIDRLAADSGIPSDILESDFKVVHQRHGTSEYAFSIEELTCLRNKHPDQDVTNLYAAAIDVYRESRRQVLRLYPTVESSLQKLNSYGCLLVAYTESMEFYTKYRIKKLGLDLLLDYLYSPPDHRLPDGLSPEQIRFYSAEHYRLVHTKQEYTPRGELKPNPHILTEIINAVGAKREETVYVGDSLMKDIIMAKEASVVDVWAKYGLVQNQPAYELLRRVTHWPVSSVEREKILTDANVKPSFVLKRVFGEILELFDFVKFNGRP